eukprot:1159202-Pelagomonas_calceolata.AAC.7
MGITVSGHPAAPQQTSLGPQYEPAHGFLSSQGYNTDPLMALSTSPLMDTNPPMGARPALSQPSPFSGAQQLLQDDGQDALVLVGLHKPIPTWALGNILRGHHLCSARIVAGFGCPCAAESPYINHHMGSDSNEEHDAENEAMQNEEVLSVNATLQANDHFVCSTNISKVEHRLQAVGTAVTRAFKSRSNSNSCSNSSNDAVVLSFHCSGDTREGGRVHQQQWQYNIRVTLLCTHRSGDTKEGGHRLVVVAHFGVQHCGSLIGDAIVGVAVHLQQHAQKKYVHCYEQSVSGFSTEASSKATPSLGCRSPATARTKARCARLQALHSVVQYCGSLTAQSPPFMHFK